MKRNGEYSHIQETICETLSFVKVAVPFKSDPGHNLVRRPSVSEKSLLVINLTKKKKELTGNPTDDWADPRRFCPATLQFQKPILPKPQTSSTSWFLLLQSS